MPLEKLEWNEIDSRTIQAGKREIRVSKSQAVANGKTIESIQIKYNERFLNFPAEFAEKLAEVLREL